jgi:hypothetical protein
MYTLKKNFILSPNTQFVDFLNEALFRSLPFHNGVPIYHDVSHLNETGSQEHGKYAVQAMAGLFILDWTSTLVRRLHADEVS